NPGMNDPIGETPTPLRQRDFDVMMRFWQVLDGLTPLSVTIQGLPGISTHDAASALERLMKLQLVKVPEINIAGSLDKFQRIAVEVAKHIGVPRNTALLKLGLQSTQGYSPRGRMFNVGTAGEVGVDLSAARAAGVSISGLLKDLEDWQVR